MDTRWMVETVFSSLKRMFGEYVYSVKIEKHETGIDVKSITI